MKKRTFIYVMMLLVALSILGCGKDEEEEVGTTQNATTNLETNNDPKVEEVTKQPEETEIIAEEVEQAEPEEVIEEPTGPQHFEPTDEIMNASLGDFVVQIGDMIVPFGCTVGEFGEMLVNSKAGIPYESALDEYSGEKYTIPATEMISYTLTQPYVCANDEVIPFYNLNICSLDRYNIDNSFDTTSVYLPHGIAVFDPQYNITVDEFVSLLENDGFKLYDANVQMEVGGKYYAVNISNNVYTVIVLSVLNEADFVGRYPVNRFVRMFDADGNYLHEQNYRLEIRNEVFK